MSADEIIDAAIEEGFLYRRERLGRITRITFTKLVPSPVEEKTMREKKYIATSPNPAEAAELAFIGIKQI